MQPQSPQNPAIETADGGQPPALPTVPAPSVDSQSMPQPGSSAAPAPAQQAAPAAPAMADDGDLIEKEWVAKVKQVMRGTAHDPYELNRQFTQLKADYMQKRYGKSIKLDG